MDINHHSLPWTYMRISLETRFNDAYTVCSGSRWGANQRFDRELTLEQTTYSLTSQLYTSKLQGLPFDLLMEIANEILTWNCLLCHSKGYSFNLGIKVILGMRTTRPVSTIPHWRSLLSRHLSICKAWWRSDKQHGNYCKMLQSWQQLWRKHKQLR